MPEKDVERRRWNFPYRLDQSTRWLDNDQYSHLNNSVYPLLADSINNTYLIDHCGIEPSGPPSSASQSPSAQEIPSQDSLPSSSSCVIGLVISASASYYTPASFPNRLQTGLRVVHLGSSSVTYEVGVFEIPPKGPNAKSSSMSAHNNNSSPPPSLPGDALACCLLRTTHVFVNRKTRRPVKPMPKQLYEGLSRLKVDQFLLEKGKESKL